MDPETQVKAMVAQVVSSFESDTANHPAVADYIEGWALGRLHGIQQMLDSGMTAMTHRSHIDCTKLIFKTREEIRDAGGV